MSLFLINYLHHCTFYQFKRHALGDLCGTIKNIWRLAFVIGFTQQPITGMYYPCLASTIRLYFVIRYSLFFSLDQQCQESPSIHAAPLELYGTLFFLFATIIAAARSFEEMKRAE